MVARRARRRCRAQDDRRNEIDEPRHCLQKVSTGEAMPVSISGTSAINYTSGMAMIRHNALAVRTRLSVASRSSKSLVPKQRKADQRKNHETPARHDPREYGDQRDCGYQREQRLIRNECCRSETERRLNASNSGCSTARSATNNCSPQWPTGS